MKRGVGRVVGRIVEGIVERLLNGNERKLRNSGVSKQGSHDSIATFPHIILQNIQFFNHNSGEVGPAILEAFMMQRKRGRRRERLLEMRWVGFVGRLWRG